MCVLFVCVGNAARSQMAEALFNHMASGDSIAASVGTRPADRVSSKAAAAMDEMGIDISGAKPKPLTAQMVRETDRIITMCGEDSCKFLPEGKPKIERWSIEDPRGKDLEKVRETRDEIKERVKQLIEEMKNGR